MADQRKVTKAMLRAGGKVILRERGCHRRGAKPTREDYRLALAVYQAMERVRADGVRVRPEACTADCRWPACTCGVDSVDGRKG